MKATLCVYLIMVIPVIAGDLTVTVKSAAGDLSEVLVQLTQQPQGLPAELILKEWRIPTGENLLAVPGYVADGEYFLFFRAPGYAAQWERLSVTSGKPSPSKFRQILYPKQFVTIRYHVSESDAEFDDSDEIKDTAALSHWGNLPVMGDDWQLWQSGPSRYINTMFSTSMLHFHRLYDGYGFADFPAGLSYESATHAPTNGYRCVNQIARPGLKLFCRIKGGRRKDRGYAKLEVLEVSTNRPTGIKIYEDPKNSLVFLLPYSFTSIDKFRQTIKNALAPLNDSFEYYIYEKSSLGPCAIGAMKDGSEFDAFGIEPPAITHRYGNVYTVNFEQPDKIN